MTSVSTAMCSHRGDMLARSNRKMMVSPSRKRWGDFRHSGASSEPFEEKMARLSALWRQQQAVAIKLDQMIEANLQALGF